MNNFYIRDFSFLRNFAVFNLQGLYPECFYMFLLDSFGVSYEYTTLT